MKKFKVMLSVFMVIIIILVSIMPVFAVNKVSTHQAIINEDLSNVMKNSESDEKIKVYLWYKDIDQNEVDALTTEATGLTPEKCAVIEEFPSVELISSLKDGDANAKTRMDAYLKRTEPVRKIERERTEIYSQKHTEISNEKYNQKSRNIRDSLSISDNDVEFSSQFAPMIIAEMTKEEIVNASKNINIEEISLYVEKEPVQESLQSALEMINAFEIGKESVFGLTGESVKVGIIETNRVMFSSESSEGIELENNDCNVLTTDNGGTIRDYGNIAVVNDTPELKDGHATNVAKLVLSISPNSKIYCSSLSYFNIETMVSADVKLFNLSMGMPVSETNSNYCYIDEEKWFDYLIANHGVTVIKSAGNNGNNVEDSTYINNEGVVQKKYGPRVTAPGMAYNIVTVGSCHSIPDKVIGDSSYKNDINGSYGCEKPDVIMPADSVNPYFGTSFAAPLVTGTIASLYELKPSLANQPHLVKAITIASCHQKVGQTDAQGGQETLLQGITDRQGAGVPDAWTMARIVCQGSYGYGSFTAPQEYINFVQPTYGASSMNVSVAWLRENYIDESLQSVTPDNIVAVQAPNIDLSVYRNDMVIKTSTLQHSSTEMCYINELTEEYNYKIKLSQNYPPIAIKYAYAWSTNNMYAPLSVNQDSINYIRSASAGKYITYDTDSLTPSVKTTTVTSQTEFSDAHCWILKKNDNAYNMLTGYGTTKLYLGQSSTKTDSSYDSQLSTVAQTINIHHNGDGTVCLLNSTSDKILTVRNDNTLVWNDYDDTSTPVFKQKWYLDKVNYLCGDANMDGDLETGGYPENSTEDTEPLPGEDYIFVQNYIAKNVTMNNLQLFLADMDKNGVVDLFDTLLINQFAKNKYY